MNSQQYSRGVLPTYASTHSSRIRRELGEDIENGDKGHLAATSKDDTQHLLPTVKPTSAATAVATVRRTHEYKVLLLPSFWCTCRANNVLCMYVVVVVVVLFFTLTD